jgi:hypothetical protein
LLRIDTDEKNFNKSVLSRTEKRETGRWMRLSRNTSIGREKSLSGCDFTPRQRATLWGMGHDTITKDLTLDPSQA